MILAPTYRTERAALYHAECCAVMRTLAPGTFGAVIADPPYSSGGLYRGDRMQSTVTKYVASGQQHDHADFSGDNRDQRSYAYWSTLWMSEALRVARPGALLMVFTDWRQLPVTTDAVQAAGWLWRGIVTWDKTEAVRPQLGRFRNQSEYVVWASRGRMPLEGKVAPGVVRHPVERGEKLHIAAKPVPMLYDLLQIAKGPVLDPFCGAAPAGVAALQHGLEYVGIEIDPAQYPIAEQRMRDAEGMGPLFAQGDIGLQAAGA